ncbi:MAG: tRNA pseudouridine(55) synthase TruB [Firmicutes bacterium]|nr:tRNA pseudouridine(55) synthase TruB [Bacillota bacterium]
MRDGILVINKPQNWTSSDCVAVCRRVLGVKGIKKVGHGGTLDPMATGVLPIFVGQATRIMEYMDLDYKTYVCGGKLGLTTETLDIWGEVTSEENWEEISKDREITKDRICEALESFQGWIEQIPPKYSAVRINGKRLYEYAYKGREIDVEIKPRRVYIRRLSVVDVDMTKGQFVFEVECSKGTYIRTICADLGEKLGCGCTMTALERVATGNISIDQARITADEVKEMDAAQLEELLLPADYPLIHFGRVTMSQDRAEFFARGNSIRWKQITVEEEPDVEALLESGKSVGTGTMPENARGRAYNLIYKVYEQGTGRFLGTGYYDEETNELKADKVFVKQKGQDESI